MLDQQIKIKPLSDEDVEAYLNASDGNPGLDNLSDIPLENTPVTIPKTTTKSTETKEEVVVDNTQKKEIKPLSLEDEKFLEENTEVGEKEDVKSSKKLTKKEIENSISYKDIVSYHIEEGDWDEEVELEDGSVVKLSEIPEEEFTKEAYQNLLKYQTTSKAKKAVDEEKAQYGQDATELLDYLKKGGKLENISDLYRQSADVESLDVTKPEGALKAIGEYLAAIGEDEEAVSNYLEMVQDRGEDYVLKDGAKKKAKLKEAIDEQKQEEFQRQSEFEQQRRVAEAQANQRIRETIYKDSSVSEKEKKELDKYRFDLKFEHPYQKGQKISQYFTDFQKVQQDPSKNLELMKAVKAISEGKGYKEPSKIVNEEKEKTFSFLRKNQSTLKNLSSERPEFKTDKNSVFDIDKVNRLLNIKI